MATGDRKVNIHVNKLLSKTAMREYFLEYLSRKVDETIAAFFVGSQGTLDDEKIGLAADGADRFKLDLSNANRVGVQGGQFITIPDENDVSKYIKFENAAGIDYHVGIRFNTVEWNEIDTNARYGYPEYPTLMDSLGEKAAPTSVVNTPGVKIALNIDSITEAGVDHSGRTVKCWLAVPASGVQAQAFYEGVSYYSVGHNYVDIPYSGSNGPLGQDTGSGPPSTTAGDYVVFIKGVTWRRNVDLHANADYWYAGTVRGAGAGNPPTVFDTDAQNLLFLITLDRAYDGPPPYPGFGRVITVDAGAVELQTGASGSGDTHNAQLRISRKNDTGAGSVMLELLLPDNDGGRKAIPIATMAPINMTSGTVQANEPVTLSSTNRINFTRGGALDLYDENAWVHDDLCLVQVQNTDHDGLYFINGWGADYMLVKDMRTGADPVSWTSGDITGTATVYRVIFAISLKPYSAGVDSQLYGSRFLGIDGQGGEHDVKFYPCGNNDFIRLFDSEYPIPIERGKLTDRGIFHLDGLRIKPRPVWYSTTPDAADIYQFTLDCDANLAAGNNQAARCGQIINPSGREALRIEASGRFARGRRHLHDFDLAPTLTHSDASTHQHEFPRSYVIWAVGTGSPTVRYCEIIGDGFDACRGGQALVRSGDSLGDISVLWGPQYWYCRAGGNNSMTLHFYAKMYLASVSYGMFCYCGFHELFAPRIYWGLSTNGTNLWTLVVDDGVTTASQASSIVPAAGYANMVHLWITVDPFALPFGAVYGTVATGYAGSWTWDTCTVIMPFTTSFMNMMMTPALLVQNDEAAATVGAYIDAWEIFDTNLRTGDPQHSI